MKVKSVLGVLISCLFLGCAVHRHIQPIEETRFLMDTVVRVSVYPDALSVDTVRAAIHEAFDEMERIERITSSTVSSSDVSLINSQANAQWTPISKETYTVMKTAMNVSENTDGAFDVTVGIADQLWNFTADQPNIPDEAAIRAILSRIGFRAVDMDPERCRLKQSGMRIDLGGLAKGYIVDKGVESLIKAGLLSGIVDAGGDLRLFGEHPTRNHWRIGIRHPRSEDGSLYGVIETGAASIATSGDYERYFIRNGIRYHHILDPRTGKPAERCISVTIVANTAMMADAYATAVFVLGPVEGMDRIRVNPDLEGLILYEEDEIHQIVSEGLQSRVKIFD